MSNLKECEAQLNGLDEAERIYAAEDIGYMNDPEGVAILLKRLDNESSPAVRDIIFQALIRIDGDAAIEGCIRLFASDQPQLRNQAVDALRHKGEPAVPFLNSVMHNGDRDTRKLVLDTLKGKRLNGTDAIYAAALSDPDQNVVITAVENLGQVRAEQFRGRIEGLIQADSHPMLVAVCHEALAKMAYKPPVAAVEGWLPC